MDNSLVAIVCYEEQLESVRKAIELSKGLDLLPSNAKLFLDSCWSHRWRKAASILYHHLKNVKKVVPQNMHFILVI